MATRRGLPQANSREFRGVVWGSEFAKPGLQRLRSSHFQYLKLRRGINTMQSRSHNFTSTWRSGRRLGNALALAAFAICSLVAVSAQARRPVDTDRLIEKGSDRAILATLAKASKWPLDERMKLYTELRESSFSALAGAPSKAVTKRAKFALCGSATCTPASPTVPIVRGAGMAPDFPKDMMNGGAIRSMSQDAKESAHFSAPVKLSSPSPQFLKVARIAKINGYVIIQAVITDEGLIDSARILQGLPMGMTESSLVSLFDWRFEPAKLNGKPVPVYYNLQFNYQID